MEKIEFTFSETSETVEFFVVEQTMLNGIQYLLVTDSEEDEAEAYLLKNVNNETDKTEAMYEMVDDETELNVVGAVFAELLEDIELK